MTTIKQYAGKYNNIREESNKEAIGKCDNEIQSILLRIKTLKKEEKKRKQGLMQKRVGKNMRKKKKKHKIYLSLNDEVNFRYRNEYKDDMLLITASLQKDNTNKNKYDAYNKDKRV